MTHLATPEASFDWGSELGKTLSDHAVIALVGDLGAGKTQVSKGIVAGLNSQAAVSSPTFAIVNEYPDGRLPVFHFDFYRLDSADEVLRLGWDDYLDEPSVVIVEWADRFPELLPAETRWFHLDHAPEGGRTLREGGQSEP
jgi:tRNA threonylcarbamoyladenosine biosynthesis protein TsaE